MKKIKPQYIGIASYIFSVIILVYTWANDVFSDLIFGGSTLYTTDVWIGLVFFIAGTISIVALERKRIVPLMNGFLYLYIPMLALLADSPRFIVIVWALFGLGFAAFFFFTFARYTIKKD